MPKLDNTCTEYPNMTQVLDQMLYSKRKMQNKSQTILANLMGRSRNCIQQIECHEHMPTFLTMLDLSLALELSDKEFSDLMLALLKAFREDLRLQDERDVWCEAR